MAGSLAYDIDKDLEDNRMSARLFYCFWIASHVTQ